jgi:hypothetical protein
VASKSAETKTVRVQHARFVFIKVPVRRLADISVFLDSTVGKAFERHELMVYADHYSTYYHRSGMLEIGDSGGYYTWSCVVVGDSEWPQSSSDIWWGRLQCPYLLTSVPSFFVGKSRSLFETPDSFWSLFRVTPALRRRWFRA